MGFVVQAIEGDYPTPQPVVSAPAVEANTAPQEQTAPQLSNADAKAELDRLMSLSKKGGLVTTYEFSDSASVVYADNNWYTQTVQFKKDFLAKIGTLKKAVTGYRHFEVRDAYSDEKVAEITSFSGSLEVYK